MTRNYQNEEERQIHTLTRKVDKACKEFNMLTDGDRILVGVSGGKDSLALLLLLNNLLKYSTAKYTLVAAHIRGDANGITEDLTKDLVDWITNLGIKIHIRDTYLSTTETYPMNCERCSRNRRRTLFEIAKETGCNKLALGHNMDDFAQTALMNLLIQGKLEAMPFIDSYFNDEFTLIRPLMYLRESEALLFSKECNFPVIKSKCPLANSSKRKQAKDLLSGLSDNFKDANRNILNAVLRNEKYI